ncbi:hypothetical protein GSI_05481 [Ganoderma sinense ZZ0214-1]|uniref:Uncharacterized protein n=1 Tax=Ganoderma sinense ZZ0214-1 TaxID=1077348 RepID=A0A2G8SEN7_9APHY|nr:hypothetical protein GSI_05481 [Ganoderma sinense ZZ0214-1]
MKLEETSSQREQNMQAALDLQNDQLQANSKLIDIALAQVEVAKEYQTSVQKRLNGLKARLRALEGVRAGLEARLANASGNL